MERGRRLRRNELASGFVWEADLMSFCSHLLMLQAAAMN
jgi:hypothetical protein